MPASGAPHLAYVFNAVWCTQAVHALRSCPLSPSARQVMWYLTEASTEGRPSPQYWLGGTAGGGRTIGRKHVDIRLKASSVSRTHAKLSILKAAFYTPSVRRHSTSVSVQDSSAYGTFLKYPPGHASNRGEVAGHHRRLDKDTPTDVCEDALLAFGAPSAWWRVAWEHIAVCPTRLSIAERSRLDDIASATSLEVSDTWSEDVTHLVTNHCVPTSFKFLTAVAYDRHVVTPAWVEAVNLVVTEACKNITDVGTEEAAIVATKLPEEKLFFPLFSFDELTFPQEVLTTALEPSKRARRKGLFDRIAFAFAREERRSKWALIITQLGGCTMLAQAVKSLADSSRVIFVREDGNKSEVDNEKPWMAESTVIEAILAADLGPLQSGFEHGGMAEATDVATPGPLDVESDADSDESDGTQQGRNPRQIEGTGRGNQSGDQQPAPKLVGTKRGRSQNDSQRKRSRGSPLEPTSTTNEALRLGGLKTKASDVVKDGTDGEDGGKEKPLEVDNAAINERAFFAIPELPHLATGSSVARDELDVRPFRRNSPPAASVIPLKRVPVLDGARRNVHKTGDADVREREARARKSNTGAELIESDGE